LTRRDTPPQARRAFDPSQALKQAMEFARQGRLREAAELGRRILAAAPDHFDTLHLLSEISQRAGNHAQAVTFGRKALNQRPGSTEAMLTLGAALAALGRTDEAIARYAKALAVDPRHVGALNNLGLALAAQAQAAAAIALFQRALAIEPQCVAALVNLGTVLHAEWRFEEAAACFLKALAIEPNRAESENNLGNSLLALHRTTAAIEHFQRAQALAPSFAMAHCNEATAHLMAGDYSAGWAKYEWRWSVGEYRLRRWEGVQPLWRGDADISGKTIFLTAEQGYGDTIQFARYAPLVAERGARVLLAVPPALVSLMKTLGGAEICAEGADPPAFDFHCPLMSLPLAFGTELATVPNRVAYLRPDPEKATMWRRRFEDLPGRRVGLAWSGSALKSLSPMQSIDRRRSVALAKLAPLAEVPGASYVSLQLGGAAVETRAPPPGLVVHDWTGDLHDFSDTAALIAGLDLVISVDTAVAHLAGALGKPVWLLNRYDTCWRWLLDRDDSPWYPTLRQFRQPAPGDWDAVIAAVSAALASRFGDEPCRPGV
jgi:tetratricopeptide (TPR) repeat protein